MPRITLKSKAMSHQEKELGHASFNPYVPFDFKAANDNYTKNIFSDHDPPVGASSRVGIITCCDARSSPDHFFQLSHNQAFIIRNGGGRTAATDVIRTIASIEVLSNIKEIMVIHHTGTLLAELPRRPAC